MNQLIKQIAHRGTWLLLAALQSSYATDYDLTLILWDTPLDQNRIQLQENLDNLSRPSRTGPEELDTTEISLDPTIHQFISKYSGQVIEHKRISIDNQQSTYQLTKTPTAETSLPYLLTLTTEKDNIKLTGQVLVDDQSIDLAPLQFSKNANLADTNPTMLRFSLGNKAIAQIAQYSRLISFLHAIATMY